MVFHYIVVKTAFKNMYQKQSYGRSLSGKDFVDTLYIKTFDLWVHSVYGAQDKV